MTQVVLYHDDEDGFGAAYAIWWHDRNIRKTTKERLYIPVNYGQPVPELPEDTTSLTVVDFSYDRATCDALFARYPDFLVLDHHKTAEAALEGAVYARFDQSKSGAVLTWKYFNPDVALPIILGFVQDRDLWRWALPQSEEVNLYISTLDRDFMAWDNFTLAEARSAGQAIKKYQDRLLEKILETAYKDTLGPYSIMECYTPVLQSEVGNALCKRHPDVDFAAMVTTTGKTEGRVSLRSVGDTDVSVVAKNFGGGGHKNAAGFTF